MDDKAREKINNLLKELLHRREALRVAWNELCDHAYAELQQIARPLMARWRRGHTLQATALVNEVLMKLQDELCRRGMGLQNEGDLKGVVAVMMWRYLVDYERRRKARRSKENKKGEHERARPRPAPVRFGGLGEESESDARGAALAVRQDDIRITLVAQDARWSATVLDFNEALEEFARTDPRAAQILARRFLLGQTYEEIAREMGCKEDTVDNALRKAKKQLKPKLVRDD